MIRYFALLSRLPDVDPTFFHDHWRHPHGTYGGRIPGIRSYVQAHHVPSALFPADQDEFEAISIIEFDSVAEARGLGTERQYYDWILPDEPSFMDKSKAVALATDEEVLVPRARAQDGSSVADSLWYHLDRSISFQMLQFIRPGGNPAWAGADDVELGRRVGALRHVRNRPLAEFHGDQPPFLGARQLWWATWTDFVTGVERDREAFERLLASGGDSLTLLVQSERSVR